MAKGTLVLTIHASGVKETLRAYRKLPKEANKALREDTLALSKDLATKVAAAGVAEGGQAALVAKTVKARKDRVPVIAAGGVRKVGSRRAPAYKVLFGSEFGATYLKQYKPHLGRGSYWFYKTVEKNQRRILRAWTKVADKVAKEFRRG